MHAADIKSFVGFKINKVKIFVSIVHLARNIIPYV